MSSEQNISYGFRTVGPSDASSQSHTGSSLFGGAPPSKTPTLFGSSSGSSSLFGQAPDTSSRSSGGSFLSANGFQQTHNEARPIFGVTSTASPANFGPVSSGYASAVQADDHLGTLSRNIIKTANKPVVVSPYHSLLSTDNDPPFKTMSLLRWFRSAFSDPEKLSTSVMGGVGFCCFNVASDGLVIVYIPVQRMIMERCYNNPRDIADHFDGIASSDAEYIDAITEFCIKDFKVHFDFDVKPVKPYSATAQAFYFNDYMLYYVEKKQA